MTEEAPKRKRGRPKRDPEDNLVTQTEFMRQSGLPRNNFAAYVAEGRIVYDQETKLVDKTNPVNARFLRDQKRKAKKKVMIDTAQVDERTIKANLLKVEADARWKSIKAQREMNELISVKIVENTFGLIGKNIRNLLFPVGTRLAPNICAICGTTDSEIVLKVQTEIEEEIAKAIEDLVKVTVVDIQNDDSVDTVFEDEEE